MISSFLFGLEGMMLLTLLQHDRLVCKQPLSRVDRRLLKLLAGLCISISIGLWIIQDNVSMGIAHGIMLLGLVALFPVFILSLRRQWLRPAVIIVPLISVIFTVFA